eukprot:3500531-Rhodomonas_salina.2
MLESALLERSRPRSVPTTPSASSLTASIFFPERSMVKHQYAQTPPEKSVCTPSTSTRVKLQPVHTGSSTCTLTNVELSRNAPPTSLKHRNPSRCSVAVQACSTTSTQPVPRSRGLRSTLHPASVPSVTQSASRPASPWSW